MQCPYILYYTLPYYITLLHPYILYFTLPPCISHDSIGTQLPP